MSDSKDIYRHRGFLLPDESEDGTISASVELWDDGDIGASFAIHNGT